MSPESRDVAYLWDMLDAAEAIYEFTKDANFARYIKERMCQLAVERCMEVIGEAARKVSDSFKQKHPEIPWQSIIAQRNVIAHEYGEIMQERIFAHATKNIPQLISQLKPLIPILPEDKKH